MIFNSYLIFGVLIGFITACGARHVCSGNAITSSLVYKSLGGASDYLGEIVVLQI